jgi:murein lipoprotein
MGVKMNHKLMLATALTTTLLLAGCSSGPDEDTTAQMSRLNSKIDNLTTELMTLKGKQSQVENVAINAAQEAQQSSAQAEQADALAKRANDRIDNIVESYTK